MFKNLIKFETLIENLLIISILLSFLDSYQILNVPISWLGQVSVVIVFSILFFVEKIKISDVAKFTALIALLPTFFNYSAINEIIDGEFYTELRVFSFIAFMFVAFTVINSNYKHLLFRALRKVIYFIMIFSLYIYIAQLFNFYEPYRNRPGTGILGFDSQVIFWISGSHRLVGTFREPLFLVSLLFPAFLTLHYKGKESYLFYLLSGIVFGLTKSEFALILLLVMFITQIILKKVNLKLLSFVTFFLICFFIPIKECDISPMNIECPQILNETIINDEITEDANNIENSINNNDFIYDFKEVNFEDRERIDIFSFATQYMYNNSGFGFQNTNKVYTDYLSTSIKNEMYLLNRTQPEYLHIRYLAQSFGTGRYFLTYENINIQNNFLFNYFSIGSFYFVLIALLLIFKFHQNFNHFIYITLFVFTISFSPVEDLLPIIGLCFGLVFTMDEHEY